MIIHSSKEDLYVSELWKEICFILQDISPSINEELYEQKIIQSLEKLGWSRFHKEIILKQSTQLGSAGTIIPDIIVKSLDKNEFFVIEVKKPSADIENQSHKKQLFSYMRQLKLEHGLLIGNKIQIYHDGKSDTTKDPILLKSIDISELNKDGLLFINLFKKESFSHSQLEIFAEETVKELATESHKKKLHKLLLSSDYESKIQQFIEDDLQQNWGRETIKKVLSQLSISICAKNTTPTTSPTPIPPDTVVPTGTKIGELVRNSMNLIIANCKKSEMALSDLKSKHYSKNTFNINYPFLKKVNSNDLKQKRYWKAKYMINNEDYVVTSEWYKGSLPLFEAYLAKISQQKNG